MKKRISLLATVILLALTLNGQELTKRLVNKDIVDMVALGLSDELIIDKVRSSADTAQFDTSVDALKALKEAKVSDAVIRVMINPRAASAPAATLVPAVATVSAPDPNLPPQEVGVFWKDDTRFIFIEGQTVSNAK